MPCHGPAIANVEVRDRRSEMLISMFKQALSEQLTFEEIWSRVAQDAAETLELMKLSSGLMPVSSLAFPRPLCGHYECCGTPREGVSTATRGSHK
jgi:hypothetical protein